MGCFKSKPAAGVNLKKDFVNANAHTFKTVLIGNSNVGKSCIVLRWTQGVFSDASVAPTIGAAFFSQSVTVPGGQEAVLHLWDTAGEETYRSLTSLFTRNSYAAVLTYDVTSKKSFEALPYWIEEFKRHCPDALIVLAANKSDLAHARQVTAAEGEAFAKENGLTHFETSAKTGANINKIFEHIGTELIRR